MPIESVSIAKPSRFSRSRSSRSCAKRRRCRASSGVGSGTVMSPRSFRRGNAPTCFARCAASEGATPLLVASPETLTWMQTCSSVRPGPRACASRAAIFARSIEWTQSKCSAIARVLLLWIGPM